MTAAQACERLLNLFPATAIRSAWRLGNITKERAVEQLAKTASAQETDVFAFDHFTLTKQHVHLFLPSAKLDPSARLDLIAGETPVQQHTENAETQYFYLLDLRFEVVFLETLSKESIDFKWPILLVVRPDLLMAKFTIMEKDVRSYFQDADTGRIVVSRRGVDETAILKLIRDQLLRSDVKLEPLDINRGVKALWAQGYIDSQEARFKKPRSTSNETMDERYFVKRDVPDVYAAVRRAPILKAQFQFMRDQEQFVPHFVVEASSGILRFPMYGNRRKSTLNVIAKILELN